MADQVGGPLCDSLELLFWALPNFTGTLANDPCSCKHSSQRVIEMTLDAHCS